MSEAARAYVRVAAALSGLTLDDDSFEAVAANTRILQALYAEFAEIEFPDELDPAAVLRL